MTEAPDRNRHEIEEQVELDFVVKGPVSAVRELVETLSNGEPYEFLTIPKDISQDRKLVGPFFLSIDSGWSPPLPQWEYKIAQCDADWPEYKDIENWLNKLAEAGWEVEYRPEELADYWHFKRKVH